MQKERTTLQQCDKPSGSRMGCGPSHVGRVCGGSIVGYEWPPPSFAQSLRNDGLCEPNVWESRK